MRGIKIPQQDSALKMQGGLMREGGRICGTLRYILGTYLVPFVHCRHQHTLFSHFLQDCSIPWCLGHQSAFPMMHLGHCEAKHQTFLVDGCLVTGHSFVECPSVCVF